MYTSCRINNYISNEFQPVQYHCFRLEASKSSKLNRNNIDFYLGLHYISHYIYSVLSMSYVKEPLSSIKLNLVRVWVQFRWTM